MRRYFYSDPVGAFLTRDETSILGLLAQHNTFALDPTQRDAWLSQIQILKATLSALIKEGHLYLAVPPLFRLAQGPKVLYARDDAHRDQLLATEFAGRGKVEISRFKGLGEMPMQQLRDTTMDPARRTLLQVGIVDDEVVPTRTMVQRLMGNKPEERFAFIQERAAFAAEDLIDV